MASLATFWCVQIELWLQYRGFLKRIHYNKKWFAWSHWRKFFVHTKTKFEWSECHLRLDGKRYNMVIFWVFLHFVDKIINFVLKIAYPEKFTYVDDLANNHVDVFTKASINLGNNLRENLNIRFRIWNLQNVKILCWLFQIFIVARCIKLTVTGGQEMGLLMVW